MEGATDPSEVEHRLLYRIGLHIHDRARLVLVGSVLLCVVLAGLATTGADWAESYGEGEVESLLAGDALDAAFSTGNESAASSFVVLMHHATLNDSNPAWQEAVQNMLAPLSNHPEVRVNHSWTVSEAVRDDRVTSNDDGFWALTYVSIDLPRSEAKELFSTVAEDLEAPAGFDGWVTDGLAVDYTFEHRIHVDLVKAEMISAPLSLIILGLVFGSLVAALLPVAVGVFTVLSAVGVTIWLSHIADLNNYALNIISLIGIGVSIDYSLFLVNRFREEVRRGRDARIATAMTVATAGRAVLFSGVTVAVGLMGLLFFEHTALPSLGLGGTLAVSIAMVYAVVSLPALMAVLGPRIESVRIPFSFAMDSDDEQGFWGTIATTVMARPWAVFIPVVLLLVGAGIPFIFAEFSLSGTGALPPEDEARQGLELIDELWPEASQNAGIVVLDIGDVDPLSEASLRVLHAHMTDLLDDERVTTVVGPGLPDASMSADDVVAFWTTPEAYLDSTTVGARAALQERFVAEGVTWFAFTMEGEQTSPASREVVVDVRAEAETLLDELGASDGAMMVGGFAAYNQDILNAVGENLPLAIGFILSATVLLIFLQVRSVVMPFKAIAMNILSLTASFGMLVVVFQWGFGENLLNFSAQPIDVTNPVLIFCIVFGLSMDYEVLMLSRIHEEWERTGDNTLAVANGLQRTGRLITGAAAIMVVVFSAFGLSSIVIIKQIGFGLALAILIDATLVRALVVPSAMRLMGSWNWWSPSWLPQPARHAAATSRTPARLDVNHVLAVLERHRDGHSEE